MRRIPIDFASPLFGWVVQNTAGRDGPSCWVLQNTAGLDGPLRAVITPPELAAGETTIRIENNEWVME